MNDRDSLKHQGMRKRLTDALRMKGIKDTAVLEAIGKIPRHLFMESSFVQFAYRDQAFPIGAGQTISQPYTVAFQTELLDFQAHDKILEIGTGSGYQTAVLCALGASVYTMERQKELYFKVQQLLPRLGYCPNFFLGDGYKGLPTYGPFNKILVTAGAPEVPRDLLTQLTTGGRMVIPLGASDQQKMTVITRTAEDRFERESHGTFVFVPMLKGIEK